MFHPKQTLDHITEKDEILLHYSDALLRHAKKVVEKLPEEERPSFKCHSISRALHLAFEELEVVDGYYLSHFEHINSSGKKSGGTAASHSWLVTPSGCILDAYPLATYSLSPILRITKGEPYDFITRGHYQPHPETSVIAETEEVWKKARTLFDIFKSSKMMQKKETP